MFHWNFCRKQPNRQITNGMRLKPRRLSDARNIYMMYVCVCCLTLGVVWRVRFIFISYSLTDHSIYFYFKFYSTQKKILVPIEFSSSFNFNKINMHKMYDNVASKYESNVIFYALRGMMKNMHEKKHLFDVKYKEEKRIVFWKYYFHTECLDSRSSNGHKMKARCSASTLLFSSMWLTV